LLTELWNHRINCRKSEDGDCDDTNQDTRNVDG